MFSRILLLCFLGAFAERVFAECVIQGLAIGYEGRRIAVVALDDELTAKRSILAQSDINERGEFQVLFDPGCTRRVYLYIQRVQAAIYVQPGKSYEVIFPQVGKDDYRRFDETEVTLQFVGMQEEDINLQIRRFNAEYAKFISEHFYDFAADEYRGSETYMKYLGERKNSVDLYAKQSTQDSIRTTAGKNFQRWVKVFEDSVYRIFNVTDNDQFVNNYLRYSIAELHLLSGMKRELFYENYFMSIPPQEFNPAYMSCFKLFVRNVLTLQKAATQSAILKAINIDRDLNRLTEALTESSIASGRLRKMAAFNGLKEVYNNKSFDKNSIEILLEKVNTGDSLIDRMAQATLFQLTRCREGWTMQEVVFTDETQEKWMLSDADGLPLYILFFATWSPSSLKELKVLERYQEKYKGKVSFVGICMDDDYGSYRKFLEDNMKLPIKMLYGNAETFVSEKFNLKSIPHQVMLDPEKKVLADVCPAPSSPQLESFMNRWVPAVNQRQGPKTWRDN